MAINNRTVAQVQGGLSATDTTEDEFQTDIDNMIAQVDRSVNRVSITGAMVGDATLADGTVDNRLTVNVTAGTIGTNGFTGIPAASIADADLVALTVNGVEIGRLLINT